MNSRPAAPPAIALSGLSIVAPGGATLLRDANFALAPGEVLLIVGPSGSGKSTLIRLLSGLLERSAGWVVQGTLTRPAGSIDLSRQTSDVGGLVFQNHALFDDLNARDNLAIVADHRAAQSAGLPGSAGAMLADIDPGQSVAASSGGQRQRLAIARTLLSDPAVLLFDEPNAGLDIAAARWLASTIRDLCRRAGKPAIIVAHHVDEFITLADRAMVLDPSDARLHDVPVDRAAIEAAMLQLAQRASAAAATHTSLADTARGGFQADWTRPQPRRPPVYWFWRYLREYLWVLFAAPSMLLYVGLGSAIVGFVTVWFGFNYNSFGGYLRAVLHDETLEGLGFVLTVVAVPFNTCILIVARNSAIIAADLGNRVSGMQFQAMRNLRLPGRAYIVAAIMISLAAGSLFLVAAALITAYGTSLLTWHYLFPNQPTELFQENFFRKLAQPHFLYVQSGWVALKVVCSAMLGGSVAVVIGLRPGGTQSQVTQLIASAIIGGVSLTLLVHAVIMILQFSS